MAAYTCSSTHAHGTGRHLRQIDNSGSAAHIVTAMPVSRWQMIERFARAASRPHRTAGSRSRAPRRRARTARRRPATRSGKRYTTSAWPPLTEWIVPTTTCGVSSSACGPRLAAMSAGNCDAHPHVGGDASRATSRAGRGSRPPTLPSGSRARPVRRARRDARMRHRSAHVAGLELLLRAVAQDALRLAGTRPTAPDRRASTGGARRRSPDAPTSSARIRLAVEPRLPIAERVPEAVAACRYGLWNGMPCFRSTATSGRSMYEQDARNITVWPRSMCSSALLRMKYSGDLYDAARRAGRRAPSSGARQVLLLLAPGDLLDQSVRASCGRPAGRGTTASG